MTLQEDFSGKEMSQETFDIARAVTAIHLGPSNQHLDSLKAILIKFTQHEMESLGEKNQEFSKSETNELSLLMQGCLEKQKPQKIHW